MPLFRCGLFQSQDNCDDIFFVVLGVEWELKGVLIWARGSFET